MFASEISSQLWPHTCRHTVSLAAWLLIHIMAVRRGQFWYISLPSPPSPLVTNAGVLKLANLFSRNNHRHPSSRNLVISLDCWCNTNIHMLSRTLTRCIDGRNDEDDSSAAGTDCSNRSYHIAKQINDGNSFLRSEDWTVVNSLMISPHLSWTLKAIGKVKILSIVRRLTGRRATI